MKFCTVVLVALLGSVVAEKAEKTEKRQPIITAAIFHDTIELVSDVADHVYTSLLEPHVTKHSPKVMAMVDEHMVPHMEKAGMKKSEITAHYDKVMGHANTAKANFAAHKATAHGKLDEVAAKVASKFDQSLPKYAGAIPNTFTDLLVCSLYCLFVLYVVFAITMKIFRVSLGCYCFFCCCGCLRGGKSKAAAAGGKKGGKQDAKKAADTNGKQKKK